MEIQQNEAIQAILHRKLFKWKVGVPDIVGEEAAISKWNRYSCHTQHTHFLQWTPYDWNLYTKWNFPLPPYLLIWGMYLETRILLKVTSESYMCFAFMSFHQLLHLVLELICSNKVHTDWYSTTWKRCILLFCILLVVFGIINTLKCCHVYWAFYMLYLFCSSYILKPMILVIIVLVYFGASKDNSSLS